MSRKILFSAFLRSQIIYNFTQLFAAGLVDKLEIDRYEVYLKRKFMNLAFDIKTDVIQNITDWYRHRLSSTVENIYKKMILKEVDP